MKKKNSIMGMAFFGPALVLLTLFLFLPMLLTFGFSFTDYFALNPELTHFVGLENYINISHNHHFKWWFGLALIRAGYMLAQKGGYRKRCYWSAYKAVLLESSFLDSSACSLIYFFIASSVILPIVET